MNYPSLLYVTKPLPKAIPENVFEDLQLFNFFDKHLWETVKYPCDADSRSARREFIALITDGGLEEKAVKAYAAAERLCTLYQCRKNSTSDGEKAVLFVWLMSADRDYSVIAAGFPQSGRISSSLSSVFGARINDKKYSEMSAELDGLLPEMKEKLTFSIKFYREKVRVGKNPASTCAERIIKCASLLGVEVSGDGALPEERISPDITEAVLSQNPDFCRKIKDFQSRYESLFVKDMIYYRNELKFYLVFADIIKRSKEIGVRFCVPVESSERKLSAVNAYDVSLIAKNTAVIVPNDMAFTDDEPFFFLTGANGGGKTTYLRTVGISCLFWLLGLPVPAEKAEFGGIDCIYTHFPRDERFDGSGRFVEESTRVKEIIRKADGKSFVLLNETFSSTNEENAKKSTSALANELNGREIFGLYITHQHGLADEGIPYLHVLIDKNDQNRRTFRVVRERNAGGSFASDILKKYGLTAEALEERFGKIIGGEQR